MQSPYRPKPTQTEIDRKYAEAQELKAISCDCGNGPDWSKECDRCHEPVCSDCAVELGGEPYCVACAKIEMDLDEAADRLIAAETVARRQAGRETVAELGVEGAA